MPVYSKNLNFRSLSKGSLFALLFLLLFVSYKAGHLVASYKYEKGGDLFKKIQVLKKENSDLNRKITELSSSSLVQIEISKNLENHLKELQQNNTELTQNMALYQAVAGSRFAKGMQIKSFQVFSTENANKFRYLVVLSKDASPEHFAVGALTMTILGKIGDKKITLPVKYVDSTRNDGLAFKFRHLQELAGELSLPENFIPQSVLFQVKPDKDWLPFQQKFAWFTDKNIVLD